MAGLIDEMNNAQKTRDDLMKWKLAIVSVAGAAGLGLGSASKSVADASLVLAVIPLASAYVDLLCRNLSVRSKRITAFLATEQDSAGTLEGKFASFYYSVKEGPALESWALWYSTVIVCVATAVVGAGLQHNGYDPRVWPNPVFYGSAVLGLLSSIWTQREYSKEASKLRALATATARGAADRETAGAENASPSINEINEAEIG